MPLSDSIRPATLAATVTVVSWASAFVAIRDAGHDISPGALNLIRMGVAAVILGVIVAARRERLPGRREIVGVLVCGVSWFGVYGVALNAGEQRVDAGTAAMVVYVGPVLIAVMAGLLLGEGFPRWLLVGCTISLAGVVVIGLATSDGPDDLVGLALCLAAAALYATGVIAQKPLLDRRSSLSITFAASSVGALVCLPFAPALVDDLGTASAGAIAWAVYLGVVPTALAFTTWAYALGRSSAGRMASISYLVPALAVLMGWAILGERPVPLAVLGGAVVVAGVVVARRRPAA